MFVNNNACISALKQFCQEKHTVAERMAMYTRVFDSAVSGDVLLAHIRAIDLDQAKQQCPKECHAQFNAVAAYLYRFCDGKTTAGNNKQLSKTIYKSCGCLK